MTGVKSVGLAINDAAAGDLTQVVDPGARSYCPTRAGRVQQLLDIKNPPVTPDNLAGSSGLPVIGSVAALVLRI